MIYVIARDGGCEGYSGPIQAFKTKEEAIAAVALGGGCLEVFAVPEWPEPSEPWYQIRPISAV